MRHLDSARLVQAADSAITDVNGEPDHPRPSPCPKSRVQDTASTITAAVLRELAKQEIERFKDNSELNNREMLLYAYLFPKDPIIKRYKEVKDFFDGDDPNGPGRSVDLPAREWRDENYDGWDVDLSDVPPIVKIIRFRQG